MLTELQPVRGFKCPISIESTENPVYLKGCEHFFDRAFIEQFFRGKFANSDIAPCPMCNRPYSIIKFLPDGREQAIARLFERILIVPLVTHEINRKLVKWENHNQQLVARDQRLAERDEQIARQDEQIATYNQQLVSSQQQLVAYQQQIVDREQQIEVQKQQIEVQKQEIEVQKQYIQALASKVDNKKNKIRILKEEVRVVEEAKNSSDEANSKKLVYNEKTSNLALGIIGVACIPAVCVAPGVGMGMLAVTVITFVATSSAKESNSKSIDLNVKKQQ